MRKGDSEMRVHVYNQKCLKRTTGPTSRARKNNTLQRLCHRAVLDLSAYTLYGTDTSTMT
jgi:hypothetical protein